MDAVPVSADSISGEERLSARLQAVNEALDRPWWQFRLSRPMERAFEDATVARRCRETRTWLLVAAAVQLLCLAFDAVASPAALLAGLFLRGGLVVPLHLLAARLSRPAVPPLVQGAAAGLAILVGIGATLAIGQIAPAPFSERYFMAAGVGVFATGLIFPLRPMHAVPILLLAMLVFDTGVLGGFGATPTHAVVDLAAFMSLLALIGIGYALGRERSARQTFLLRTRDELRRGELELANRRLQELSITDPLTGLFNRRYFTGALARTWDAGAARGRWLAILMVDIDRFKDINDRFGHAEGDRCIGAVAAAVRGETREGFDIVARFGGEEFVVLLPEAGPDGAFDAAERVRLAVEGLGIAHPHGGPVTVSVGAASGRADPEASPELLIQRADEALYEAKAAGRNCAVLAGRPKSAPDPRAGASKAVSASAA